MAALRSQPQGLVRLDRGRDMFAGAQGVINAPHIANLATGAALRTVGAVPKPMRMGAEHGVVLPFRKNWLIETETLPAIGTASFVEFWIGYPDMVNIGCPLGSSEAGFLVGSSANQSGICATIGSTRTNTNGTGTGNAGTWGCVAQWGGAKYLYSSNDVLTNGVLTVLVVIRRQTGTEFWRNGVMVNFIAGAPISIPAQTLIVGSFISSTTNWCSSSDTLLAGRVRGEWTAEEAQRFSSSLTAAIGMTFAAPSDDGDLAVAANLTLMAEPGAFALSGSDVGVRAMRRLSAVQGPFSLVPQAVNILTARRMAAGSGVFALSGASVPLIAERLLPAGRGTFILDSAPAGLRATRRLTAQSSSFALSLGAVQMVYMPVAGPVGPTYTLSATSGAFALAGRTTALQAQRRLPALSGAFDWTGPAAALLVGRRLPVAVGGFSMVGAAAMLRSTRRLSAQTEGFSLQGVDAQLSYSAQVSYARAPAGVGYAPPQHYNEARPAATNAARPNEVGPTRPPALQRNNR